VHLGGIKIVNKTDRETDVDEAAPSDDIRALARMIEYASLEAKRNGLLLTSHLLDLAGWSLKEPNPDPITALNMPRDRVASEKPN
jgi:hypothetical protein